MLAIAAMSFSQTSETFIRDHVRHISPGDTALISRSETRPNFLGCPVLTGVPNPQPTRPNLAQMVVHKVARRWNNYSLGIERKEEDAVVEFLQKNNVRALLVEYLHYATLFGRAAARAGVPLFPHAHGFDASILLRQRHWQRLYRRLFESAAGVITPSNFIADMLNAAGCPREKLHVSPCGIDPTLFSTTRRVPFRLLSVGRFVEKKGPQHTIAAFAKAQAAFPQARLDMIGDGPLHKSCQDLIDKLHLKDHVALHGSQPSETVQRLMSEASVFLQHSVTAQNGDVEGLPVAILEAMSSALPVVSTRHSGIMEAVMPGETGILVDEYDVEGMADAIVLLLNDPAHAKLLGEAGRQRVLGNFTHVHTRDRLRAVMGLSPALSPRATQEG